MMFDADNAGDGNGAGSRPPRVSVAGGQAYRALVPGGRASRPTMNPTQMAEANGGQDARPPTPRPQSPGGRASRPTVSPMQTAATNGGQDARPPTKGGQGANSTKTRVLTSHPPEATTQVSAPKGYYRRGRKHPPHLDYPEKLQHIIFRLAGSLPQAFLDRIKRDQSAGTVAEDGYGAELLLALEEGHGPTWLARPEIADVVQRALEYFGGERYDLHTWCIMPNHVHVLLRPRGGFSLCGILQSWKSFTAKKCNEILGRSGTFWQDDYFDRYMRDQADVEATAAYILNNGGRNSAGDQATGTGRAGGRASRPTVSPMQTAATNGGQDARPPTPPPKSSGGRASRPTMNPTQVAEANGGQDARPPTPPPKSSGGRASRPTVSPMQTATTNGGQDARPPTKGSRDTSPPTARPSTKRTPSSQTASSEDIV